MNTEQKTFQWWMSHQKETLELMEKFPAVTTMTGNVNEQGEVILEVGTIDGKPIENFPSEVDGTNVVFRAMRPEFL